MSVPVYDAFNALLINCIELPHIYDGGWQSPQGANGRGRPAKVRVAIPRDLNIHARREGRRGSDDSNPSVLPRLYAEVFVHSVEILMPHGGYRSIDIGITLDGDLVKQLPTMKVKP